MIRYSTQSDSPRSVRWPIGNYCQLEIKKIFLFASRTIGNKIDISCRISASGTQKALPALESFKENRSETRTHFFVQKKHLSLYTIIIILLNCIGKIVFEGKAAYFHEFFDALKLIEILSTVLRIVNWNLSGRGLNLPFYGLYWFNF